MGGGQLPSSANGGGQLPSSANEVQMEIPESGFQDEKVALQGKGLPLLVTLPVFLPGVEIQCPETRGQPFFSHKDERQMEHESDKGERLWIYGKNSETGSGFVMRENELLI
jgi:hypothetical protein